MSYHPLSHGLFRRPLSGLGGAVSESAGVPGDFIAASRYAGGLLDKYNGKELLNSLVTAYNTPGQSQDAASVISKEIVNKGTAAGCAAVGTAGVALLGVGAPIVGMACSKIAGAVNAEMNRPQSKRVYVDPGPFHAELLAKAQASCAPGDNGCKQAVAAEVAYFTTGEISPLRVWNLWAGGNCPTLDADPGCAYDEGLMWDERMGLLTRNVAKFATASRLKAEGDFARATVAAAQGIKPQFYPLCAGDVNCEASVNTGIDLAAMRTALALRTQDEPQALQQWATELADVENEARENAKQNADAVLAQKQIQSLQAQVRLAEAARLKAEFSARTAASKAKTAAKQKARLAAEASVAKSDKRKRVVGAAVLAVALGAAIIMADKKRRRR